MESATDKNVQLSKEWLQDIPSNQIESNQKTKDWLTTELSKPHSNPLSLQNKGAVNTAIDCTDRISIPANAHNE